MHERGSKMARNSTHRSARYSANTKLSLSPFKSEIDMKTMKKDSHRHSLDGYDLNNVAGKNTD
jgi:hypothetical protein